jgi:hypothetical protein
MDKFADNWLPNIVVQGVFWLFDHSTATWAVVVGFLYLLRKAFAGLKAKSTSGDLLPDPSTGMLTGTAVSTSMASGHLAPHYRAPPNIGQFILASEPYDTHRAAQDVLRFERNKMAAVLASTENPGSPQVLLDQPPRA